MWGAAGATRTSLVHCTATMAGGSPRSLRAVPCQDRTGSFEKSGALNYGPNIIGSCIEGFANRTPILGTSQLKPLEAFVLAFLASCLVGETGSLERPG